MTDLSTAPGSPLESAGDRDPADGAGVAGAVAATPDSVLSVLTGLEANGWRALHELGVPGRRAIDHVAIGPGGIFVIDAQSLASGAAAVDTAGIVVPDTAVNAANQIADEVRHVLPPLTRQYVVPVLVHPDHAAMSLARGPVQICTTSMLQRVIESRQRVLSNGEINEIADSLSLGIRRSVAPQPTFTPPVDEARESRRATKDRRWRRRGGVESPTAFDGASWDDAGAATEPTAGEEADAYLAWPAASDGYAETAVETAVLAADTSDLAKLAAAQGWSDTAPGAPADEDLTSPATIEPDNPWDTYEPAARVFQAEGEPAFAVPAETAPDSAGLPQTDDGASLEDWTVPGSPVETETKRDPLLGSFPVDWQPEPSDVPPLPERPERFAVVAEEVDDQPVTVHAADSEQLPDVDVTTADHVASLRTTGADGHGGADAETSPVPATNTRRQPGRRRAETSWRSRLKPRGRERIAAERSADAKQPGGTDSTPIDAAVDPLTGYTPAAREAAAAALESPRAAQARPRTLSARAGKTVVPAASRKRRGSRRSSKPARAGASPAVASAVPDVEPAGLSSRGRMVYAAMSERRALEAASETSDATPATSRSAPTRRIVAVGFAAALLVVSAANISTISQWVSDHIPGVGQTSGDQPGGGTGGDPGRTANLHPPKSQERPTTDDGKADREHAGNDGNGPSKPSN